MNRNATASIAVNAPVENHFRDVTKMVKIGSSAERSIEDIIKYNAAEDYYDRD